MPKMVEAVRQVRGEATPGIQVRDCRIALVNGIGDSIGTRMDSGTLVLVERLAG
jgi:acetyl-CoA C-acetyltransferase